MFRHDDPSLSRNGASGKPGAVHNSSTPTPRRAGPMRPSCTLASVESDKAKASHDRLDRSDFLAQDGRELSRGKVKVKPFACIDLTLPRSAGDHVGDKLAKPRLLFVRCLGRGENAAPVQKH